jgi:hypothetical protein
MNQEPTEKQEATCRPFHCKGLVSLVSALSFLALVASGVALYVAPRGRVSHWTPWELLGVTRDQWAGLHITLSVLFTVAVLVHLWLNWATFWRYLVSGRRPNLVREMLVALALTAAVILMTLFRVPPVSTLVDWREDIKDGWEALPVADGEQAAPARGMGSMTLRDWCASQGIAEDRALAWFAELGVEARLDHRMRELSMMTGMAPGEIRRGLLRQPQQAQ